MKKYLFIILMTFFAVSGFSKEVYAESVMNLEDYNLSNVQNVIDDNEYEELDFMEMAGKFISGESNTVIVDTLKFMFSKAMSEIDIGRESIGNIILISIVSAFFTNFVKVFNNNGASDTGFYISYIAVMTICMTLFGTTSTIACNLLQFILEFMNALVPAFFLSVGMIGQASAVGFYQITLVVILFVNYIYLNVVIPIIKVYLVLAMANNLSSEDIMSKFVDLLKKFILFVNKGLLGVVIGINVIQGLVLPQVDNLKNTGIKKMVGVLPVIGDGSEYVTNLFLGSGMLIKNSLGTVAIVIIIAICAIPVAKLMIIMISIQVSAAIIQPMTDTRIVKSLGYVSEGINMMIRSVITSAFLFVISIAIVCLVTNI